MTTSHWTKRHWILVGALATMLSNVASAGAGDIVPASDLRVLQKLHDANQMEIEMGHLAQDKGASREMKTFGRRLVSDHTLADHKIGEYLTRRGLDLTALATTTSADGPHDRAACTTESDFDRTFAAQTVDNHQKAIDLVEKARRSTADKDLRALYDHLLPTLQANKKTAEALAERGRARV